MPTSPEYPTPDDIDAELTRLAVLAETSPERMAEIRAIKKQIEDGTYYVSPADLARSILDDIDRIKRDLR